MADYHITYGTVQGLDISLSTLLDFHDLSEEFWHSLQTPAQYELIEIWLEETGQASGAKLRTMMPVPNI